MDHSPTPASPPEVLAAARRAVDETGRAALAQIVRTEGSTPGKVGWKMLVAPDGRLVGNLGGGAFEAMVVADARARLGERRPESGTRRYYLTETAAVAKGEPTGMVCGGMVEVFLEILEAPPLLVVCGGGPVGQAVARAGELAGFDLAVVDDREEFRRPELFSSPTGPNTRRPIEIVEVDREYGGDVFARAPFAGRELYITIVTRCWETDTAALAAVLRSKPRHLAYLGLMGSRRKIDRVRREVESQGHDLDGVALHAPIGLPLGGDSPGEIAISILAEIVGRRHSARSAQDDERSDAVPAQQSPPHLVSS
jgi:xanthine dehydrogenase accessory factor